MNQYVEECLREWRRLGVADPVANEMAADLTVDLEEAEAEGASPEDVLGNNAFDPRRFAAAWAAARGVTGPPTADRRPPWRSPVAIALTVLIGALTIGAGFVLLVGHGSSSISFASRRVPGGGPIRLFIPGSGRISIPNPLGGPFPATRIAGVGFEALALFLLIVGVLGLGLLAVLYWSPWFGPRRYRRYGR